MLSYICNSKKPNLGMRSVPERFDQDKIKEDVVKIRFSEMSLK